MADARFPERWLTDRRFARLTDSQYRSYSHALIWSVSNRTDGIIELDDLALIPQFRDDHIPTFVSRSLWTELDAGAWLIADYANTQTTRAEFESLETRRANERRRKAKERAKAKREDQSEDPSPTSRDMSRDRPEDYIGKARQGKARQGSRSEEALSEQENETEQPLAPSPDSSPTTELDLEDQPAEWTREDPWADVEVRRPPDAHGDDDGATVHYLPPSDSLDPETWQNLAPLYDD